MIPSACIDRRNSFPVVTLALIIINVYVFLYQELLSPQATEAFVMQYALIPDHIHFERVCHVDVPTCWLAAHHRQHVVPMGFWFA